MKIHIVQKGETVWEIANKYGVDFEQVKESNPQISSPDMIMPGMKLKIPSSTKKVKKDVVKPTQSSKEVKKEIKKETPKQVSPKPIQLINEDDKVKPKEIKMEVPSLPNKKKEEKIPMEPQIPVMPTMPMQPIMQMPIMETKTKINLPQTPQQTTPIEKKKEIKTQNKVEHKKEVKKEMNEVNHMQMMPVCCYIINPCCCSQMHHHMPHMNQGCMPMQHHQHSQMNQMMPSQAPMQHMSGPYNECGCSGSQHMMQGGYARTAVNQMPSQPLYQPTYEPYRNEQPLHHLEARPVNQAPQFSHDQQVQNMDRYPTPPSFPPYVNQNNSETEGS